MAQGEGGAATNPSVAGAPWSSRLADRATGLAGLLAVVVAVAGGGWVPPTAAWLALPLIVLAGRWPVTLPTASAEVLIVGLESAFVVLLGLTLPWRQALVVWAVGAVLGQVRNRRSVDTRAFNVGVITLSGLAGISVLTHLGPAAHDSPRELPAVALAATAYFCLDYVWSAVSIALAERRRVRETVQATGFALALVCFVSVDSLGLLATVVLRAQTWAVGLLVVPFLALVLAAHAWAQLRARAQRGAELVTASAAVQRAATIQELEVTVLEHAASVVGAGAATWLAPGEQPPGLASRFTALGRVLALVPASPDVPLTEADTQAVRMLLAVAHQAQSRLELLGELRRSADHDPLTGLPNRSSVTRALAEASAAEAPLGLLYVDLDGFKKLNDTAGHAAGDAVLVEVAARLRSGVRPDDLAVRLGGDEFLVVLRGAGADDLPTVSAVAERLRDLLGQPYEVAGREARLGASIGLCLSSWVDGPEQLLTASDAAMYAAKAAGGSQVRLHPRPPVQPPARPPQPRPPLGGSESGRQTSSATSRTPGSPASLA